MRQKCVMTLLSMLGAVCGSGLPLETRFFILGDSWMFVGVTSVRADQFLQDFVNRAWSLVVTESELLNPGREGAAS
jgi:hypothetical protein